MANYERDWETTAIGLAAESDQLTVEVERLRLQVKKEAALANRWAPLAHLARNLAEVLADHACDWEMCRCQTVLTRWEELQEGGQSDGGESDG